MIGPVELTLGEGPEAELWPELFLLAKMFPSRWALVGAQMVILHALAYGTARPTRTNDVDMMIDVRGLATRTISDHLLDRDFELEGIAADGVGHRFVRRGAVIDVLAIDHVGERVDTTTVPSAHTVPVPGGRGAFERLAFAEVLVNGVAGRVPVQIGSVRYFSRRAPPSHSRMKERSI